VSLAERDTGAGAGEVRTMVGTTSASEMNLEKSMLSGGCNLPCKFE
jgi:hypothetical protein